MCFDETFVNNSKAGLQLARHKCLNNEEECLKHINLVVLSYSHYCISNNNVPSFRKQGGF